MTWGDGTPYDTSLGTVINHAPDMMVYVIGPTSQLDDASTENDLNIPICQGLGVEDNPNW